MINRNADRRETEREVSKMQSIKKKQKTRWHCECKLSTYMPNQ